MLLLLGTSWLSDYTRKGWFSETRHSVTTVHEGPESVITIALALLFGTLFLISARRSYCRAGQAQREGGATQTRGYMIACSVIVGIALRMLALQYSFLCVLVMLVVLSRLGRDTGFELLLVASVCSGLTMCRLLNLLNSFAGDLTFYRFSLTLEPIAVASLAVSLLITRRRLLAWVLVGYSSLMVILFLSSKLFHVPRLPGSRRGTGYAVIYCLIACLLVRWLQNETGGKSSEQPII